MCSVRRRITHEDLIGGIIASTLTPFDEAGDVMSKSITDQARRLSQICLLYTSPSPRDS